MQNCSKKCVQSVKKINWCWMEGSIVGEDLTSLNYRCSDAFFVVNDKALQGVTRDYWTDIRGWFLQWV